MTADATAEQAAAYPWALVGLDGHAFDRYADRATAEQYRGEGPADTTVVYDPNPRELSRRLDLP